MQLCEKTLESLPADFSVPAYDRHSCGVGIVHLGIGAFHRCHMAVYTDDALARQAGDWRIMGISLRGTTIGDQLNPQDGLYTVEIRDSKSVNRRVIGSIAGVMFAPDDPLSVVELMASSATRIVSLTVTEKGYCHDPASGTLNELHPDIVHDLAHPETPVSAIGFLAASLALRKARDNGPVTILSCDNLPANGHTLHCIVGRFAELIDLELAHWIELNVSFPSSMVDRIVPAIEAQDVAEFSRSSGVSDRAVLKTEAFTQWVIEDQFKVGQPGWQNVGAQLVADVAFYEEAKLRMLNGSHSAIAYLGFLAGCNYVHEAMAVPALRSYVDTLLRKEAATSLQLVADADLDDYRQALKHRFDNSALPHRTYQIAMDGSQKIPQRLLGTLRYHLHNDGPIRAASLAVAAWIRYAMGVDESGQVISVQDPMAGPMKKLADVAGRDATALVDSFLQLESVFGKDLKQNPRFRAELVVWLDKLLTQGSLATVKQFCESSD